MPTKSPVVHSDDEFLRQFPSVSREQAVAALDMAKETLLSRARTAC